MAERLQYPLARISEIYLFSSGPSIVVAVVVAVAAAIAVVVAAAVLELARTRTVRGRAGRAPAR